MTANIHNITAEAGQAALYGGARPIINTQTGEARIRTAQGLTVNSLLRADEWKELDAAVIEAAKSRLVTVELLRSRNLVARLGGIGTLVSQWNMTSAITAANVTMTGQSTGDRDLPDTKLAGVPVPVIFKEFAIGMRTLEASRRLGDGLDVTAAYEATRVVAEMMETLVIDGYDLKFGADTIYGLTNHTNRNTDTASAYGGGDWGTITNVVPTVAGMVAAANGDAMYGPFGILVAPTQFNQAALTYYTDGSGNTPIQRLLSLPNIEFVQMCPFLQDTEVVLFQLTRSVIDWAEAMPLQVLEWASPDGFTSHFKVVTVATPRVKADYDGKSGIVHATGA